VLSVDSRMVSVGSTNFDNRSFRLNDESNLNVYDEAFAQRQVEIFERDLAVSRVVTLAQWQARPLWTKIMERLAASLGPQL
jgi:cardiolipin synthase